MSEDRRQEIINELKTLYWLEIETTLNFLAISVDLDGVRAEEIKKSLAADVQEEMTHAQNLANRIKEIGGRVPGTMDFSPQQSWLQPPEDSTDVASAIRGVIETENTVIERYTYL